MHLGKAGPSLATSVCRQAQKHGRAGPPVSPSRENHSRGEHAGHPGWPRAGRVSSAALASGRAVRAPVPGQWPFPNVRLATSARLCPRTSPDELGGGSPRSHEGGVGSRRPRATGTGGGEPAPVTAGPAERPSGGERPRAPPRPRPLPDRPHPLPERAARSRAGPPPLRPRSLPDAAARSRFASPHAPPPRPRPFPLGPRAPAPPPRARLRRGPASFPLGPRAPGAPSCAAGARAAAGRAAVKVV